MKNPADSALMESPEGRQKYADAVVKGSPRSWRPSLARTS